MTFAAIRFGLSYPDLTASERLTLLILGDCASKTGHCYPGQAYLSKRTGLAVRTIRDAVQGLEKKGAIKRSKRFERGNRSSDDFLILMIRPPANSAAGDRQNVPSNPSSPYGVGKKEKKKGLSVGVSSLRVVGGTEA